MFYIFLFLVNASKSQLNCRNQKIIVVKKTDPMNFYNYATVHMFGIGKMYLNVFERTPNYPRFLKGRVKSILFLYCFGLVCLKQETMPF